MRSSRFKLPSWWTWWPRKAAPVPEPILGPVEPEIEPLKALSHVLEWVPMGMASVEVDRGDGEWSLLQDTRLHFAYSRHQQLETELQRTLEAMRTELSFQAEGSIELMRLQRTLDHFSKIKYRVREWDDQESNWQRHSMGMERPLRRIMATLITGGVPPDRVLVRELEEGEE